MAITTELKLAIKDVDKALKETELKVNNSAKKMQSSLQQMGRGAESLSKLGGNGGPVKAMTEALKGFISPVGLATAGIALLGSMAVQTFDKMTISTAEQIKLYQLLAKEIEQEIKKESELQKVDNSFISRLKQLAEHETNSNEAKKEACFLINELEKRYGKLGISLDTISGKITGVTEAERKMLLQQKEINLANLAEQQGDIQFLGHQQTKDLFVEMNKGNLFSGILEDFLYKKLGVVGKEGTHSAIEDFEGYSLESQITILKELRKQATTGQQLEMVQKVLDSKRKQLEVQKKIESLKQTGFSTAKEKADSLKGETEISAKTAEDDNIQKSVDYYFQAVQKLENEIELQKLLNEGKTAEAEKQKLINELTEKGLQLQEHEIEDILQKRKQLADLQKKDSEEKPETKTIEKKSYSAERILTNELARRGGFSSSVYIQNSKNDYNSKMLKTAEGTNKKLENIYNEIQKVGLI